ncbi:MAG: hypothetical protein QXJ68_06280 [Methanocellales archaeon]
MREILRLIAMAISGLVIGALLTLLLKGYVDLILSLFIAISYFLISMIYWRII